MSEVCEICGALVAKPKRHRLWHKRNKPIPGPPGPVGPMGMTGVAGGNDGPQYHYTESDSGERLTEPVLVRQDGKPVKRQRWFRLK